MSPSSVLLKCTLLTYYYYGLVCGHAVFSLNANKMVVKCTQKVRIYTMIFQGSVTFQTVIVMLKATGELKKAHFTRGMGIESHIPTYIWTLSATFLVIALFQTEVKQRRKLRMLFQKFQKLFLNVERLQMKMFHKKQLILLVFFIVDRGFVITVSLYVYVTELTVGYTITEAYMIYFVTMLNITIRLFEIGYILGAVLFDVVCESIAEVLENCANAWQRKMRQPIELSRYEVMLKCRMYLVQVYKLKNTLSKQFSLCTFLYYSMTFIDILMAFYSYFSNTFVSTSDPSGYLYLLLFFIRAHLFAYTAEMFGDSFRRAVVGVYIIANKRRSALMADEYLLQLYGMSVRAKDILGIFKISRALTFSMFAASVSYIIVMVQFNIASKMQ